MEQFSFSKLNNDELYTLGLRTNEIISSHPVDDMGIRFYYDQFKSAFDKYSAGMLHISISAKAVGQKDNVRDDRYLGFVGHLKNYLYFPDEDIKKSLKSLLAEIVRYGPDVQRKTYKEETSIIESIIAKVEKGYSDLMTRINADVWFNLLKEAQTDFEKTLRGYTAHKAEDADVEAPTTIRPELVAALRKLFAFLPLHYEMTANEQLGKVIAQLKIELDRF